MIQRTEGCRMMWCTNCHNFFDWITLELIKKTKYTHNPEHVAWLQRNNKMLGTDVNVIENENNPCNFGYHDINSLNVSEKIELLISL